MAGSPRVQLSLKGRLLSEVPFVAAQLRIGRMRENDVVVNNLAVSRFHATLRREGEGFVLEDLGSENGTQLNGERIAGSVPMRPTDVIQLGKYELRLVLQPGPQIAGAPKQKPSDAWDASQTFLALDSAPLPVKPAASAPVAPLAPAPPALPKLAPPAAAELDPFDDAELLTDAAEEAAAPDAEGVFAFGEEDLGTSLESESSDAGDRQADPHPAPNPEHTLLFDFGAAASPEEREASGAAAPAAAQPPLHAGLIVQRDGKLYLLRPWESGELYAGRAPECEIVLADAGVSRKHAAFSRGPSGYVVRDLESVNGIYVNGQRTKQHTLSVGDVVRIESFELTFVLDHQPIGSGVSGPKPVAAKEHELARATQFSLEAPSRESDDALELTSLSGDPSEAPGATGESVHSAPLDDLTDGLEILPAADDPYLDGAPLASASGGEPVHELGLPESDLVSADGMDAVDEEKESNVERLLRTPSAVPGTRARRGGLQLRVVLSTAEISPRAREALAALAEEGVELAAQLRIERSAE